MNTNHQHLITQLRELHKQMGEVLQQIEQVETATKQMPDRPNLKPGDEAPAIEWLKMMDDPERSEALKWAKSDSVNMLPMRMARSIAEAVNIAFDWGSGADRMRWLGIYNKYREANR